MSLVNEKLRMFGKDISFDVTKQTGGDTETASNGDWKMIEGREVLRQALIRRIITSPGEWRFKPEYGVGARAFVKAKDTPSARDELKARIRAQLLQDPRVEAVKLIQLERTTSGSLKIAVYVQPIGRDMQSESLGLSVEVI